MPLSMDSIRLAAQLDGQQVKVDQQDTTLLTEETRSPRWYQFGLKSELKTQA